MTTRFQSALFICVFFHVAQGFVCPGPRLATPTALQASREDRSGDSPDRSGWDSFKSTIYKSVDSVKNLQSKLSGNKDTESFIREGYGNVEETVSTKEPPSRRLLGQYQTRASKLMPPENASPPPRTSFDKFKENIYGAAEVFGGPPETVPTPVSRLQGGIPYKRSLAQELSDQDLISSNPLKRLKAEQKVLEQEAFLRAKQRNENVRARKEDAYKVVDALQATVDAIPDAFDQTEKAVKEVAKQVKSIPRRVDRVVMKTKESIRETVTNVKVFLRLEKPKPKPPKLPPPKPKTGKEIAFKLAGGVAKGVGSVAWWATKETASLAWKGAQSAMSKGDKMVQRNKQMQVADTSEVEAEVVEALRLAELSLKNTDEK